jgi:hypothetical protein
MIVIKFNYFLWFLLFYLCACARFICIYYNYLFIDLIINAHKLNCKYLLYIYRKIFIFLNNLLYRFERMNNINSSKTKQIPVLNRNKTYLVANEETTTKTKQSAAVSSSSSLVEFKNQKRAEINKTKVSQTSPLKSDVAISNKRSLETIILKGRQNGNINLSDFGLCECMLFYVKSCSYRNPACTILQ